MRCRISILLLCLVILFVSIDASPVSAELVLPASWKNVTLITTDGWEYSDVTVELLASGDQLRVINESGAEKILPVTLVRILRDDVGLDITAKVLAEPSTASQTEAVQPRPASATPEGLPPSAPQLAAETSPEPKGIRGNYPEPLPFSADAPRFRWALSGGLGYGFSSENGFGGQSNGLTLGGKIRMAMSQSIYILLGARYLDTESQDGILQPAYAHRGGGFHADMEELLFGIGIMSGSGSSKQAMPYLELGVGRVANSRASWLLFPGKDQVASAGLPRKETAIHMQIGVMLPLDPSMGLDFSFGWSYIGEDLLDWDEPDPLPLPDGIRVAPAIDRGNRSILGIQAGIVLFGGTP